MNPQSKGSDGTHELLEPDYTVSPDCKVTRHQSRVTPVSIEFYKYRPSGSFHWCDWQPAPGVGNILKFAIVALVR